MSTALDIPEVVSGSKERSKTSIPTVNIHCEPYLNQVHGDVRIDV
jgi:hypothetical protein